MKYIYSLMYCQTNSVAEGGTCDEVPTHTHTLYTSYPVSFSSLITSFPCTCPIDTYWFIQSANSALLFLMSHQPFMLLNSLPTYVHIKFLLPSLCLYIQHNHQHFSIIKPPLLPQFLLVSYKCMFCKYASSHESTFQDLVEL